MNEQQKQKLIREIMLDDFVGIWDEVFEPQFCEHVINFFDNCNFCSNRQKPHVTDKQVFLQAFSPSEADYIMQGVEYCLNLYMQKYPYLSMFQYHSGCVLLQKTEPKGGGYHSFHAEDSTWESVHRTLAWTVYFNDLEDSGETEFLYQDLKIKPKAGRVAIWPGSFTHLHRGNPVKSNKYIATGWYCGSFGMKEFKPNIG